MKIFIINKNLFHLNLKCLTFNYGFLSELSQHSMKTMKQTIKQLYFLKIKRNVGMANVSLIQRIQQDGKMVVSLLLYNCDVIQTSLY